MKLYPILTLSLIVALSSSPAFACGSKACNCKGAACSSKSCDGETMNSSGSIQKDDGRAQLRVDTAPSTKESEKESQKKNLGRHGGTAMSRERILQDE